MVKTDSTPRKHPATSFRVIDGQAVVMQPEGAEVHILNDIGTRVWNLVDGRRTVEEITSLVADQLRADPDCEGVPADISADVSAFITDIEAKGIIRLVDGEA